MAFEALAIFKKLVVGAAFSRLHQVSMATDTQPGIILFDRQQIFVGRAMGSVAGIALAVDYRSVGIGL